jgi:hypothetical protein
MFTYKVAYRRQLGAFFAEVLGLPEVTAFGPTVADARAGVLGALRYAAESRLRRGDTIPLTETAGMVADAYAVETFAVLPDGNNRVEVQRCD